MNLLISLILIVLISTISLSDNQYRIIDGIETTNEKGMIGIREMILDKVWCTGSIINNHFILTAGHCMYGNTEKIKSLRIEGTEILAKNLIKYIHFYPKFEKLFFTESQSTKIEERVFYDIALIETKVDLVQEYNVSIIPISYDNEDIDNVILKGYGMTDPTVIGYLSNMPDIFTLRYRKAQVYDVRKCNDGDYNSTNVLCIEGGYYGDSGGPVFNTNNEIVAITIRKGTINFNEINFTISNKLQPHRNWINSIIYSKELRQTLKEEKWYMYEINTTTTIQLLKENGIIVHKWFPILEQWNVTEQLTPKDIVWIKIKGK